MPSLRPLQWISDACRKALKLWLHYRELTFKKGDAVNIIRQIDNNWYEGEHRGRVGIFPISYVEVNVQQITQICMFVLYACKCIFCIHILDYTMLSHTQKMPSSEKQQPIRPPPPAHVREIGEAVARYNFNADTNVELSLRKVASCSILPVLYIAFCT